MKKLDYLRLISIDPYGIGNEGNGMIDILYSHLLNENGLSFYKYIKINQIHQSQDIKEFVDFDRGKVHVNIIHNTPSNFDHLDDFSKNKIRLEVIHKGLLRLSKEDERFQKNKLEEIREELLSKKFYFVIEGVVLVNPFEKNIISKISITPHSKYFIFSLEVKNENGVLCKANLYTSKPLVYYLDSFFSVMKWINKDELCVGGKSKEMNILLKLSNCDIRFKNLTRYNKPPLWEMGRAEATDIEKKVAYENWLDSLPPEYAAVIKNNN